jgi:ribosomal protein L11 methyltransferase
MPADPLAADATVVARLATDTLSARRIIDIVGETFDTLEAVAAAHEDGPGRWTVAIHFRDPPNETALRALVALAAGAEAGNALAFGAVEPKDWVKASLEGLTPVEAGRFYVHGAHDRARVPVNRIGIEIEAALAFGTGHHGTTRGCLIAFDRIAKTRRPKRILDVGTGTGVLAIAAARVARRRVLASDIDVRAVRTARDNARLNRAAPFVVIRQAGGLQARFIRQGGPFDLVFANILLGPLLRFASPLAKLTAPGAQVVLSGLLPPHANAVLSACRLHGLTLERRIVLDGWVTLILRRAVAPLRAAP